MPIPSLDYEIIVETMIKSCRAR
eukprot:COSAG02_NODE_46031_length_352_cov_0.814229_1_plen_22_part_01